MSEDDTLNVLKASRVIYSKYGGCYYFVPDYRVKSEASPGDTYGHILCAGRIYDILKDKEHRGQLFTDWLSTGYIPEHIMRHYTIMCENYARHITITYPEPGIWWKWKE